MILLFYCQGQTSSLFKLILTFEFLDEILKCDHNLVLKAFSTFKMAEMMCSFKLNVLCSTLIVVPYKVILICNSR